MTHRHPRLTRSAVGLGALLLLIPAVSGQTPPGMVEVPSFGDVPVPSGNTRSAPPYPSAGSPGPGGAYPSPPAYPQPPSYPPAPAYPAAPDYPAAPSGAAPYPATTPGYPIAPSAGSGATGPDCERSPESAACLAASVGSVLGALSRAIDGAGFSLSKARTRPCPSDVNVIWSQCQGRITLESGDVYEGTFRSDQRHGVGVYTATGKGYRYAGEWLDNEATGKGTYEWSESGNRYVGDFVNLTFNGRGVLYGPDGAILSSGEWKNDELVREIALDTATYAFTRDFGVVPLPPSARPAAPGRGTTQAPPPPPSASPDRSSAPQPTASACTPGPYLESIDFASPEYIGVPGGRRARMCFMRSNGRDVQMIKFFPGGIFYQTGQVGSGGFAMSGSVLQTVRGTYGISGNTLSLRIAYSGTGVTQTVRGAGSERSLDVAGSDQDGRAFTLPNCQVISLREETRRVSLGPVRGAGHPDYILIDGERWERNTDCGDWEGWK